MQDRDLIDDNDQGSSSDLTVGNDSSESASGEETIASRQQTLSKLSKKEETRLAVSRSFSGPLPPPEALKAYDIVEPGLARRIFELAERQAEHRMDLEKAVVFGDGRRSWAGLVLGFIIACLFLGSSTYIIVEGHDLAGGLLAGGGLVSLVSVFVYGTKVRVQERAEKRKALLGEGLDDQ